MRGAKTMIEQFLSTPSARRATGHLIYRGTSHSISIHALREEGDYHHRIISNLRADFYPRPPRGGRLSMRLSLCLAPTISIHALREEGDRRCC